MYLNSPDIKMHAVMIIALAEHKQCGLDRKLVACDVLKSYYHPFLKVISKPCGS